MNKYKEITGVIYRGRGYSNALQAISMIKAKKTVSLVSIPGKPVMFYYNEENGNVLMPSDVTTSYMLDGKPATAKNIVEKARMYGFNGSDTSAASKVLRHNGHIVGANPNPQNKLL